MKLLVTLLAIIPAISASSAVGVWPLPTSATVGTSEMPLSPLFDMCFGDCSTALPADIQDGWVSVWKEIGTDHWREEGCVWRGGFAIC